MSDDLFHLPFAVKVYPICAGVLSAIGSVLLTVEFWQAVIIAVITGILTGVGAVISAVFAARIARKAVAPVRDDVANVTARMDAHDAENGR